MTTVRVESNLVTISLKGERDFHAALDRCRSLGGAWYDGERKLWCVDATPHAASEICDRFSDLTDIDDGFQALVTRGRAARTAQQSKSAADAPPVPGEHTASWTHQRRAFHFAKQLDACLLYVAMGAGKTKMTIDLICDATREESQLVLILCPLAVVPVWPDEISIHGHTGLEIKVLACDSRWNVRRKAAEALKFIESHEKGPDVGRLSIVVINYESAWREPFRSIALKHEWEWVVCDESQKIKSPSGRASRFCANLRKRAARRLCLTGTPMPNNPLDLYAQFRFLDPTIYPRTFAQFKARYAILGGYQVNGRAVQVVGWQNQEDMAERMDRITFQASSDVLDLPEATHVNRYFELNEAELKAYRAMERDFVVWLGEDDAMSAANVLVRLLRLQQITCGYLTDKAIGRFERFGESKEQLLLEVLAELGSEPASVYCHFTDDLAAVKRCTEKLGRRYGEISGKTKAIRGRWRESDGADVLGVQIRAGGLGIDLTHARYQIYYSLDYDMGSYEQSLKRIHRPGQTRPVTYVHLVARETTDEKVRDALRKKRKVVDHVREMLT